MALLWIAACGDAASTADVMSTPDVGTTGDSGDTVGSAVDSGAGVDADTQGGAGQVVYRSGTNGRLYRIAASEGAAPHDLSAELDALSPGVDDWINVSPDGAWILIGTERFGCDGWGCAVRLPADLSQGEVIRTPGGEAIHPTFSAISNDGALVVYPESSGDGTGLMATRKSGAAWSAPEPLTGASPNSYHELPALSDDGEKVLFACGETPYAQESTGICEVGTDGAGFRTVIGPKDGPGGTAQSSLRSADYAADGSIIFEADWDGEQVWTLGTGGAPRPVTAKAWNDNSPCALPGGRVASLWLDRPGGQGHHELKIAQLDDAGWFMALVDVDIADVGIGCAR